MSWTIEFHTPYKPIIPEIDFTPKTNEDHLWLLNYKNGLFATEFECQNVTIKLRK